MNNIKIKASAGLLSWVISFGYPGIIFLMILESCALPVPSEAVLGISGFLSGEGKLNFYLVILSATIGTLIGSSLLYYIGRKGGRKFIEKYGKYLLINPAEMKKAEDWFEKYGSIAVLIGIILPIVKTYIGFPAGASLMNYKKFVIFIIIGSTIYNIIVAFLGMELGKDMGFLGPYFHKFGLFFGIALALLVVFYIYRHVRAAFKN